MLLLTRLQFSLLGVSPVSSFFPSPFLLSKAKSIFHSWVDFCPAVRPPPPIAAANECDAAA
jgi:hypothetical protein